MQVNFMLSNIFLGEGLKRNVPWKAAKIFGNPFAKRGMITYHWRTKISTGVPSPCKEFDFNVFIEKSLGFGSMNLRAGFERADK